MVWFGWIVTDSWMNVQYSEFSRSAIALRHSILDASDAMPTQSKPWLPDAGTVAVYRGRSGSSERNVRVVAEACGGCMVVEAIGRKGELVRLTVKQHSLQPMQPGLFD